MHVFSCDSRLDPPADAISALDLFYSRCGMRM
jgi:hypothetical protein